MKKYRLGEVCTIIPGYAAFERVTILKFALTFNKFDNLRNLSKYCLYKSASLQVCAQRTYFATKHIYIMSWTFVTGCLLYDTP